MTNNILAVVTDIEGTTTPITFVHETLFPFAKNNLKSHLIETFSTNETQQDIILLAQQALTDSTAAELQEEKVPQIDVSLLNHHDDTNDDENREKLIEQIMLNVQFN